MVDMKACKMVAKNDVVCMSWNGDYVTFLGNLGTIITKKIAGDFPPWRSVVPTNIEYQYTASRLDLIKALMLVKSILPIEFDFAQGIIKVSDPEIDKEAKVAFTQQGTGTIEGIKFNWYKLLECLKSCRESVVTFKIDGLLKPAMICDESVRTVLTTKR
jgi:DNA polymerase III sliding clamp (beta) subunit (PCNA family)